MKYAGFWKRGFATLIDIILFMPFLILQFWLYTKGKTAIYIISIFIFLYGNLYYILLHGFYGKTLGKFVLNIQVVALDGLPITIKQAAQRNFVEILFSCVGILSTLVALEQIGNSELIGLKWMKVSTVLQENRPQFSNDFLKLQQYYFYASIICILFNKKRRALHDFIGNTVVIDNSKPKLKSKKVKLKPLSKDL